MYFRHIWNKFQKLGSICKIKGGILERKFRKHGSVRKREEMGHVDAQSAAQKIATCFMAAASTRTLHRKLMLAIRVLGRSDGSWPLLHTRTPQINFPNKPDRTAPIAPCEPKRAAQITFLNKLNRMALVARHGPEQTTQMEGENVFKPLFS